MSFDSALPRRKDMVPVLVMVVVVEVEVELGGGSLTPRSNLPQTAPTQLIRS